MHFYLDESGSTGDVAKVGTGLDFGNQPIFVLAAVGTVDPDGLAAELRRLAAKHGVISAELRSKNLVERPGLAGDLADYLARTDSPVFIEMMDKRFLIIMNLTSYVVVPPGPEDDASMMVRRAIAEAMAVSLPDTVLIAYAKACDSARRDDLLAVFPDLLEWAREPERGSYREILTAMIEDTLSEIEDPPEPDWHLRFLPAPDRSVTGRSIAMLPGLSALTNIYARINKYRNGDLADVTLVHDEHMLFGGILEQAKATMEDLSGKDALPVVPNADYKLREYATLVFASSSEPGIQAADVLAGLVMRFFRNVRLGKDRSQDSRMAMDRVMQLTHQPTARGINFVADDLLISRAYGR